MDWVPVILPMHFQVSNVKVKHIVLIPDKKRKGEALEPEVEPKFIVFEAQLKQLMKFCPECGSPVIDRKKSVSGSHLTFHLQCHAGHDVAWVSQPTVNYVRMGNLLLAAATLFNGLTFSRMEELAKSINLAFPTSRACTKLQRKWLHPVIDQEWKQEVESVVEETRQQHQALCLAGDGRSDSPGFNAHYGSYTLMNISPDVAPKILSMELVDVAEVPNSAHMETEGLKRCIASIEAENISIGTITTDQHMTVQKIMRTEYPKIDHQLDLWHVSKNLTKKMTAKAKQRGMEELGDWIRCISNHLWMLNSGCPTMHSSEDK
ncbi:hypothetical protein CAPTEDRAFT_191711 [Capitella teleta]|uniref:Uncharacterized protein n=1 Tax=Capitella teleta TaxID=283909 RepID=R7V722_CAPTE|nr:hypothetical protein CAPTEDRAFT_191711 [Capitella teleta]|eukprot:ELU14242.1 hypothetical protein CAPTEDRAFT_191711 [Capitella teleta]